MSDLHIEMTEDALHNLNYEEFVVKYGEIYHYMYDEIRESNYV
jgi:hypothetical protein